VRQGWHKPALFHMTLYICACIGTALNFFFKTVASFSMTRYRKVCESSVILCVLTPEPHAPFFYQKCGHLPNILPLVPNKILQRIQMLSYRIPDSDEATLWYTAMWNAGRLTLTNRQVTPLHLTYYHWHKKKRPIVQGYILSGFDRAGIREAVNLDLFST
jgi:hypothetical protein